MAQVPREAVEFARMLVRAFYPPEFIVVSDAVLRHNNYCAHHDLARRLRIQPKELRQILVRMVHAKLMRNEKRQQKRINLRDERRPTRTVNTEFWYVPLAEVVDAFSFRVHTLTKEFETRRANELEKHKYVCRNCASEYELLDILATQDSSGNFICSKIGVRPDRRPIECGGLIREENTEAHVKETERIIKKLDEELRPLRSRAHACSKMEIPAHPLEGADEKTWGELVPETVGVHGEAVDEEGLDKELSAKLNDKDGTRADAAHDTEIQLTPGAARDDRPIPAKPSWFESRKKDGDDADDDWVDQQGGQNVLNSKTGTAASFFAEEDEKSYYERYLKEIGGDSGGSSVKASTSPEAESAKAAPARSSADPEVIVLDEDEAPKPKGPPLSAPAPAPPVAEPAPVEDDPEDAIVHVTGKQMKLSEVTEEMTEKMTAEEYKAYYALAQGGGGGDAEDDDDDFE